MKFCLYSTSRWTLFQKALNFDVHLDVPFQSMYWVLPIIWELLNAWSCLKYLFIRCGYWQDFLSMTNTYKYSVLALSWMLSMGMLQKALITMTRKNNSSGVKPFSLHSSIEWDSNSRQKCPDSWIFFKKL